MGSVNRRAALAGMVGVVGATALSATQQVLPEKGRLEDAPFGVTDLLRVIGRPDGAVAIRWTDGVLTGHVDAKSVPLCRVLSQIFSRHRPRADGGFDTVVFELAYFTDLDRRGLLDTTLVWVTTEFGRTPKVNKDSGRDHWARCYSILLAGGGFRPGLVYGASDATAGEPARDAVPLEDLLFTIYHQLGIDAEKELVAFGTRPIEIVKDGHLVKGLLG